MKKSRSGVLLNVAVVVGGTALAVLLFAFVERNWNGDVESLRTSAPVGVTGGAYQVEIRNGCGTGGLAGETRLFLRRHGFDVVESGNHNNFDEPNSLIIDRGGNLEAAHQLARTLGVDQAYVSQETTTEAFVDATVILGHDYRTLAPFMGKEDQ